MKKARPVVFTLIIITAIIVLPLLIFGFSDKTPKAESEEDIRLFLTDNGIVTVGAPKVKTVLIPEVFSDVYENYNALQKSQGFDLYPYRGKYAKVYTYIIVTADGVRAENTEAHIMVLDGRIIGGDVASTELGGEMNGIRGR